MKSSNSYTVQQPQNNTINLINNFNNNLRSNTSAYCVALYDFEAENPGELGFKVSDLTTKFPEIYFSSTQF